MKKIFIVLDGIDSCGKTTQARLLAEYLKKKDFDVIVTHEPSNGKYGKKIKKLVKSEKGKKLDRKEWARLFVADRKWHVASVIKPALRKGKIVLCDRYYYSTMAYQLLPAEWKNLRKFLKPSLTLIFDIPVKVAMKRITKKMRKEKIKRAIFEKEKFLRNVRKKFLIMPKLLHENIKIVNANRDIKKIFVDVRKEVDKLLK